MYLIIFYKFALLQLHIEPQLFSVFESSVPGSTVGHKPSHFLCLICSIINILGLELDILIVVLPSLVRCHQRGVGPVGGSPVEHFGVFELPSVERRLQHEHQPNLVIGPLEARHDEVILEYDQV